MGDSRSPRVINPPLVVRRRVPIGGDQMCGSGVIGRSQENCLSATGKFAGPFQHLPIRVEVLERLGFAGRGAEDEKAADQVHSRILWSSSGQMLTGPFPALMCGQHSVGTSGCARAAFDLTRAVRCALWPGQEHGERWLTAGERMCKRRDVPAVPTGWASRRSSACAFAHTHREPQSRSHRNVW